MSMKHAAFALALLLPTPTFAAEPVTRVDIYVEPYYSAAPSADQPPQVAIGETLSSLLASTRKDDITAVRDRILAGPDLITPMTMMVLAIRLYDMGLRDDAVFWFYAAKDRYVTLSDVIDMETAGLTGVDDAVKNFSTLAGPVINGYAFCDIASQTAIRAKAIAWVEAHPYKAIMMPELPAQSDDRDAALAGSLAKIKSSAAQEKAYLDDDANRAKFVATRAQNEMDARFCWK